MDLLLPILMEQYMNPPIMVGHRHCLNNLTTTICTDTTIPKQRSVRLNTNIHPMIHTISTIHKEGSPRLNTTIRTTVETTFMTHHYRQLSMCRQLHSQCTIPTKMNQLAFALLCDDLLNRSTNSLILVSYWIFN